MMELDQDLCCALYGTRLRRSEIDVAGSGAIHLHSLPYIGRHRSGPVAASSANLPACALPKCQVQPGTSPMGWATTRAPIPDKASGWFYCLLTLGA